MARRILAFVVALAVSIALTAGAFAMDYQELSRGSRDSSDSWAVISLQMKLKELGYITSTPDGVYGADTERAVKAFQEANGLEPTGVADDAMQKLLYSVPSETGDDAEEEQTEVVAASRVDVMILQSCLYNWGFSTDQPDGKLGARTRAALTLFMKYAYNDMVEFTMARRALVTPEPTPEPTPTPEPGQMGEIVDAPIIPEEEILADGNITDEWFYYMENGFDWHTANVTLGDTGADAARVQRRLYALKYLPCEADGSFGGHSFVALKYFQRLNGLAETGVLDEETQLALFSGDSIQSDIYVTMYKAMVSVKDQRVYIYQWTGANYTTLVHTFVCSTGTTANPTITGTFQAPGRNGEWYYMEDSYCWVRYAFVIQGGYFFHSVLYNQKGGQPTASSVSNLGRRASHGCIRLSVEDAQWIYENCSNGMTVTIYED